MPQAPEIIKQLRSVLASVTPAQAEKEIVRIDAEIKALQEEQSTWRTLLGLTQQIGGTPSNGSGHEEPAAEVPPLRQAILAVMNAKPVGTAMRLGELSDDLQDRGWLTDSKKDMHRLQMMASTLVKEDKLSRPRKGLYQLASGNSTPQEALPDAHENENGEPRFMATHSSGGAHLARN